MKTPLPNFMKPLVCNWCGGNIENVYTPRRLDKTTKHMDDYTEADYYPDESGCCKREFDESK